MAATEKICLAAMTALASFGCEPLAQAATNPFPDSEQSVEAPTEIVVYGRGEHRIGEAVSASEGSVAGADISVRPLLRPAELLEAVPGLIATQHSGGGKANQYFLRGFNLDHGTDFSLLIDGMPMNFRTHGHGQGYLDVGGLIPEAVERVDYRKGPYRTSDGDFSFVGSARISTHDMLNPFASIEVGEGGYRRLVAGGSSTTGSTDLLVMAQYKRFDGPWSLPEDMKSWAGFAKLTSDTGIGTLRATLNIYRARWNPTEQIPERAIGPFVSDAFGTLDPSLKGRTDRQILTLDLDGDDWRLNIWGQRYNWSLFSNFTYFLDDPINGDQLRQYEKMWGWGGKLEKDWLVSTTVKLTSGVEWRHDAISQIGLDHSINAVVDFTRLKFAVREQSAAVYSEARWTPDDRWMVTAGVRADTYRFRTRPLAGSAWGGVINDSIISPKIGVSYRLFEGGAVYANFGEGFHSNDARGVTSPTNPAQGLVEGNFKELGTRIERGKVVFSGDYWWSRIASELIYVGDSGAVEPSGAGIRHGYELSAFWRPRNWLAIDAVWTASKSRYADLPRGANAIPGALKNSGEIGVSAIFPAWNAAIRVRHLGPHALTEDNSARGEATTLVNIRSAMTFAKFDVSLELLNVFDSRRHDIDYFYVTRLPGEPAEGVEGYNSRIVEPRQFRLGLKVRL